MKLLAAFRILNKQLAESNTQLKQNAALSELRINELSSLVLQTRNENRFLRSMVRKLKEQIKMITQVMVSVKDHAETLCDRIEHDQEQEENYQQLRQPVAPSIYERKRAERVAFVDDGAIQEDESVPEELGNDESSLPNHSSNPVTRSSCYDEAAVLEDEVIKDKAVAEHQEEEQDDEEDEEDEGEDEEEGDDEDSEPNVTMELPAAYAHLAAKSPLVQRLKRKSRRGSFNESFETIDRDRVFKLGRHSQSQRDSYVGLSPNHDSKRKNEDEMDLETSRSVHSQKRNDSDMEIDESITETVRKISLTQNEASLSFNSVQSERHANLSRSPYEDTSNNSPTGRISSLRKTISESALPLLKQRQTATIVGNISVADTTVFNPEDMLVNASCSTPVTKGAPIRKRVETKMKSATELHKNSSANTSMQPVVVLQPLTEDNLKQHELSARRVRNGRSRAVSKYYYKENDSENDESMDTRRQVKLEPASSTENLSVQSYESGRPRRKAAPVNMRERSINSKLRRE
uniref:Shugoshin C-terminal domain-containing protein n=2 Tax=Anopheles albimanus TaxID=7167 RepID=A0A182FY40_ANOAL